VALWSKRIDMTFRQIRIGTRGSKLALTQAGHVRAAITAALGGEGEAVLVPVTTSGDRIQNRVLTDIGGKALFTKEIEEGLLAGRFDCAVHSMKDMPAEDPPGLVIAAVPPREDPRDAFISLRHASLDDMPAGARLGTASLRRQAQARHRRPEITVVPLRGNVDTRLAKMDAGEADAIILAAAGLNRLGLSHLSRALIDPVECPPAPAQGALAIQTRAEHADAPWLASQKDLPTTLAITAERGALAFLEGSCRTAIGAYAVVDGSRLSLVVEALTPDGARRFRRNGETDVAGWDGLDAARALGMRLGEAIALEAGDALEI
jgi:hydroxymethylbilane synthase